MVFKDNELLTNIYESINKKVEPSKDQLTRQAPLLNKGDLTGVNGLLEEAYLQVDKKSVDKAILWESYTDGQIKGCEDVIKMMASGKFQNVPKEMMDRVKSCSMFSVETDQQGKHTVIIKNDVIPEIERLYPDLKGKFKSEEQCRKDVERCRKDKMQGSQSELKESKKKPKPDYLDVDKDGNKKESMKKALSDKKKSPKKTSMKEGISSFKDLFQRVISEEYDKPFSGPFERSSKAWRKARLLNDLSNGEINHINDEEQYIVTWKNPEKHDNQNEQPLKGESVHVWMDDIKSIRRAFPEEM